MFEVTSVRVIPGGEPMSDAGLVKYAGFSEREVELNESPRLRSVRGPIRGNRLIVGYRPGEEEEERYMIVPVGIIK